jgi:CMP-N-acetylneuraminic acid synthetase
LQATSPIRSEDLIDRCVTEFKRKKYDSLATGFMCTYIEYGKNELRRQDINGFFYDDGNVYVIKADLLKRGDRYGDRIGRTIISRQENLEIDDPFDFWIVEKVLQEMMQSNNQGFSQHEDKSRPIPSVKSKKTRV